MALRRLSILSSHLTPTPRPPSPSIAASCCSAGEAEDCVFCRIVCGDSPAFKLYEDDTCLCILDINPLTVGHSLIIPKSHYPSLQATPPDVVAAMCSKIPFLSNCIVKATKGDSFNLLVNNGSAAGQVIFHTHFHIIPRKAGDGLWPSEGLKRLPIKLNQETSNLVKLIQKQISSHSLDSFQTGTCMFQKGIQE